MLDRAALERRACECHAVVKTEYDRLLPRVPAARPDSQHLWARREADLAAMAAE